MINIHLIICKYICTSWLNSVSQLFKDTLNTSRNVLFNFDIYYDLYGVYSKCVCSTGVLHEVPLNILRYIFIS